MNKRFILTVSLGVLLAALLIGLGVAMFVISKKRAEISSLNDDIKNKDAMLRRMEKQVETLDAEKSSLAGMKLSLEAKLSGLEEEIDSAKEKESSLSKKLVLFASEKSKLEAKLNETNQSMRDKLEALERKNKKELVRKSKEYLTQKEVFVSRISDLNKRLDKLGQDKAKLEKNAVGAAQVTARLMKEKQKLDHYKLGLFYENQKNYAAAVKEYEAILDLDPREADVYLRLASIYVYGIRDPERADYYSKGYAALTSRPNADDTAVQDDTVAGQISEKIALAAKLNEAEQKINLKNKRRHSQDDYLGDVIGTYREKAIKRHYNLAIIYENEGRYKEAASEYEKTLELDPDDADIHYNLAIVYDDHIQDNAKAIMHYRRYLELAPDAKDADIVAEWMAEARGDLEWEHKTR
ncbi:MAG: tetratricopeptide repeat protein [Candidatus Omnitrophica bacterium]|nr:tetratricopeptide repeat protein [Candidatus Omnitrophota bacterium]MDD5501067.1 tetratricopeptide repeat protein [Candidatus Omnitrophota bacterium]